MNEEKTYNQGRALEKRLYKLGYKNRSYLYSGDSRTHRYFVKPGHQQIHMNTYTHSIRILDRAGYVLYKGVAVKDSQL